MFMAIKFNDKDDILTKQCKNEGEVLAEKKKYEKEYTIRQIWTVRSGPGYVFLAEKKKPRPKFIWE